jgi:hypothetical protein
MTRHSRTLLFLASLSASLLMVVAPLHAQWTQPTTEELSMTAQPEVPGAAAVYLYREETTEDDLQMFSIYIRLKVLTEGGRDYANVEIHHPGGIDGFAVTDIAGRTIHPDGTIVPFTGKPFDKVDEKTAGFSYMAKVFTMPDVQVGSIIEYRYKLRNDDKWIRSPDWYIQSKLFTRKAHYVWKPTNKLLTSSDDSGNQMVSSIVWTKILPPGSDIQRTIRPASSSMEQPHTIFTVDVHDIPPTPEEEYMPPIKSMTYRVLFSYTPYTSVSDFWKNQGKHWSKVQDKFIGPGHGVVSAVEKIVLPADTEDQKLRKIYAAVMKLENSDFTRQHSTAEDKSEGLKEIHTTDDIWTRQRGSGDQIAALFVAMARAAGMQAYLMSVTDRDRSIFSINYFTLRQLDDSIAIVNVAGKELFFDPGTRFCDYQHLAWRHSMAGGMRQGPNGPSVGSTPGEPYTASTTHRVGDLTLDEHGVIGGTVTLSYTGSPALEWRQRALTGDDTRIYQDLRVHMENMMPGGTEVKVQTITGLDSYDLPLKITYHVKGQFGSSTGKRLLLPSDIFEVNTKPLFPHVKRDLAVYFHYANRVQDAIRVQYPSSLAIESLPVAESDPLLKLALYKLTSESATGSYTIRRDFVIGDIIILATEYPELRTFYGKLESKDQENVILKLASTASPASATN